MSVRDTTPWIRVCAAAEISSGSGKTLDVDPPVTVWNINGQYYATDDTCTHEKYSLAEGYIDGCEIECALHWAKFDLRTGAALCAPATRALATYPVVVAGDYILVNLSSRDSAS